MERTKKLCSRVQNPKSAKQECCERLKKSTGWVNLTLSRLCMETAMSSLAHRDHLLFTRTHRYIRRGVTGVAARAPSLTCDAHLVSKQPEMWWKPLSPAQSVGGYCWVDFRGERRKAAEATSRMWSETSVHKTCISSFTWSGFREVACPVRVHSAGYRGPLCSCFKVFHKQKAAVIMRTYIVSALHASA